MKFYRFAMKLTNTSFSQLIHSFQLFIITLQFLPTVFGSRFSSDFSRQTFKKLKSDDNFNTKSMENPNSIEDLSNILSNLKYSRTSPSKQDLSSIQNLAASKINKNYQRHTLNMTSTEICSEIPEYRKIEWLKAVNVSSFSFQAKKHQQLKFVKISKKQARRTKQWLASKLSCKTDFRWKDMGEFVYPRFLKFGQCDNSVSCSLPPGMFCKPNKLKKLTMYVFAPSTKRSCRYKRHKHNIEVVRQGRKKKNRCRPRWLAMDYKIVESCSCQC